ncbi:pirin family protein [Rhodococcus sp. IEGM 1366]|uniref:pirin family protein n=1 Tax=Rhodococcus sp. IEGM 1366 TaxID=3082223 RepID=UPI0029538FCC|nr:pirin family protein [Rhodococcus sp. IEGM 1366]MDV8069457.1 pirin family protein [Rhodococcus sp. IEGM 1366]
MTSVVVQRAHERAHLNYGWLTSRHSFPFAGNFDHAAYAHGLLLVNNDDIVEAGSGFDTHQHLDTEIVTWVLSGSLVHQDSAGHTGEIHRGLAQRMSAGTGILHSERNDTRRADGTRHTEPVHVVQMWIPPDESGITPSYQELDVNTELDAGGLITLASGMPAHRDHSAITLHNKFAALHVARLDIGQTITLPDAPYVHAYIPQGSVTVEGVDTLSTGDSLRLKETGGHRVTAVAPAEVLIWEMHAGLRPHLVR